MNKTQKHGLVSLLIGIAVVLVGAMLWTANGRMDEEAGNNAASLLTKVERKLPSQQPKASASTKAGSAQVAPSRQVSGAVSAAGINLALPAREGCIGVLQIPSLNLRLPVQSVYTLDALKMAPCRYTGEKGEISRFIICGHNYRSHFGTLQKMHSGDAVRFTNMDGIVYQYQVTEVTEVASDDFRTLKTGDWDLSLFTCNLTGQKRILVRCKLSV